MPDCLVLLYHAFGSRSTVADPHNLFVEPEALRDQLARLRRAGRHAIGPEEFLAGLRRRSWPRGSFLVTIDDGYVSTLELAAPVLAAAGVPAVLFVPPAKVGGTSDWMPLMADEPLLDAASLRELPAYGIEIGCHGFDHRDLRGLSPAELREQTVDAATALADVTGQRPRTYAYPGGWYDGPAADAVAAAGFDAAFAIRAPLTPFTVPRVDVNATDTPRTFGLKIQPWWPAALRALDRLPRVRRAAHQLIGSARR